MPDELHFRGSFFTAPTLYSAAPSYGIPERHGLRAFVLRRERLTFQEKNMTRLTRLCAVAAAIGAAACSDTVSPTSQLSTSQALGTGGRAVADVKLMDACDPTTFAGVPGGCQRNGGVTFDQFIAQLTKLGVAPAWRMAPGDIYLREGDEFMATNVGGEIHTFTEVDEFGGGVVPALNALSGNTEVAPECEALAQSDFIPPGQSSDPEETDEAGDEHYQCCIHPWMRMTVHVRER